MDLSTNIKPELWKTISESYETGNYTNAIRESMSFVTEMLRDKTGLDGDGADLVGKALGFSPGKPPRIQVNKLRTETERNIQIGLQEILKGMYKFVRNPRSHELHQDSKRDADAIILYINYLTDFLGQSQQSFTIESFLELATDQYFVADKEYVQELIETIPIRKRLDTLIALYGEKNWKISENLKLIFGSALEKLSEDELDDFFSIVSYELQNIQNVGVVTLAIKIIPIDFWPKVNRMTRLRVENMLISHFGDAWYIPAKNKAGNTSVGWISRISSYLLLREKLVQKILDHLLDDDFDFANFIARFFMLELPTIFKSSDEIDSCINSISNCLERGEVMNM